MWIMCKTSYCLSDDGLGSFVLLFSSKELWPVMDKWIKYRKGHSNVAYTPDVIIASILRLIGELSVLLLSFSLLLLLS